MVSGNQFLRHRSLSFRLAFLGATMLVAMGIVLPLGWVVAGTRAGLLAGATAGGVCLLAAWIALAVSELLRGPKHVVSLVLVGMLIRMGIPLAVALILCFSGGPLADAGFLYYLIVFYPVTLTVETLFFLPYNRPAEKNRIPAEDFPR